MNVPQRTRVIVYESTDKQNPDGYSRVYAWSSGILTKFYMTHGIVSLERFLRKYFQCVYFTDNTERDVIFIFVSRRKENV